jgi:predicted nucleic acid-binding protein
MLYFDTSFLAPLVLKESTSARVEQFMSDLTAAELTTSRWTELEFASLLARDVRMGLITADAAHNDNAAFQKVIERSFVILLPVADEYELARTYLLDRRKTGLRAGDAFHLAIASNRGAKAIYSLDKGIIKAGKILGLPVSAGIRAP